jgi:NTE family protein
MLTRINALVVILALWSCAGCASRPINERIATVDPTHGYTLSARLQNRVGNDPRTILVLAFSGGGTRAAAFSYGVLEALRDTDITVDGERRRLLDEVDVITGVSGGSFTALSYALYGEGLFADYETRFLKRDVQSALLWRTLNPLNWPKLGSRTYGRSELAAEYYDKILFNGATFGDLLAKSTPMAIVAGTDLSTGARLEFSQTYFDLLCSDLEKVRLARAAASSSAVPPVLSPVTFNNYGGTCGLSRAVEIEEQVVKDRSQTSGRAAMLFREHRDLERSADRPFIHLVDGGVSDNLALRGVLEALEIVNTSPAFRQIPGFDRLERIVVIVVNAHNAPRTDWDRREKPPGFISQLMQSSSVPIDRYSYESLQVMKDTVERWEMQRRLTIAGHRLNGLSEAEAGKRTPGIALLAIDVSFDAIADPDERLYFMNLPTSFTLPQETIDRLRRIAGELLAASPAFQELLRWPES